MGIFGRKKGGLADVIRCDEADYLVWKWSPKNAKNERRENEIRFGSRLRVKDGSAAVFVYKQKDGTMQDYIEGPFDETIKTKNLPILTRIAGLAFDGDSPFQAEIYFINLANIVQSKFAIPFFDVCDPRLPNFGVPVAVRGVVSFKISDYKAFIKCNRMEEFSPEDFRSQISAAVSRYTKDAVANAPAANNIPVVQIESKIGTINDIVECELSSRLNESFGVTVSGVDISAIETDKSSEGYKELLAISQKMDSTKLEAETADYIERLRIQREEGQYSLHMQTQSANIGAYQIEKQTEVGVAGASALGEMGSNNAGSVELGNGTGAGFSPAAMMAGIAVGGAVGQNIAGTMNGILNGAIPQGQSAPPVPPTMYNLVIDGQSSGPYDISALAQLAQSGKIMKSSLVWKPGMANWAPISTVQELSSILSFIPPETN